jgi:hypothetical protein
VKKKLWIYLTVIALLLGMAACSKQESPPAETTPAATTTTAAKVTTTAAKQETTTKAPEETTIENPFAEFMEISWLCGTYTSHLYEEGRWDELELEEMFNVDLKLWNILIHSGQMEQVEMMLAAGDVQQTIVLYFPLFPNR